MFWVNLILYQNQIYGKLNNNDSRFYRFSILNDFIICSRFCAFKNVSKWDSVAHLSLISELEDAFDVMFDSEDILHYESYENGKRILEKYGIII